MLLELAGRSRMIRPTIPRAISEELLPLLFFWFVWYGFHAIASKIPLFASTTRTPIGKHCCIVKKPSVWSCHHQQPEPASESFMVYPMQSSCPSGSDELRATCPRTIAHFYIPQGRYSTPCIDKI